MLIGTWTGVTTIDRQKIENEICGLILVKTGAAAFTTEEFEITLQGNYGSKVISPYRTPQAYGEFAQIGEGTNKVDKTGASTFESVFFVDLNGSMTANIDLEVGEQLEFRAKNLVSGSTYKVYAVQSDKSTKTHNEYTTISIEASQTDKPVIVAPFNYILIDNNIDEIQYFFDNGASIKRDYAEMKHLASLENDFSTVHIDSDAGYILSDTKPGFNSVTGKILLDVSNVRKLHVSNTGASKIETFTIKKK